ncbi:hypothetical protein ACVIHC_002175 [Bradyrhizobium diazoefficiens]
MRLIETILKLAAQIFMFFVTMAIRVISSIVGALWSAYQNRAPRPAYQSPLARTSQGRPNKYPRHRRKKWRRR